MDHPQSERTRNYSRSLSNSVGHSNSTPVNDNSAISTSGGKLFSSPRAKLFVSSGNPKKMPESARKKSSRDLLNFGWKTEDGDADDAEQNDGSLRALAGMILTKYPQMKGPEESREEATLRLIREMDFVVDAFPSKARQLAMNSSKKSKKASSKEKEQVDSFNFARMSFRDIFAIESPFHNSVSNLHDHLQIFSDNVSRVVYSFVVSSVHRNNLKNLNTKQFKSTLYANLSQVNFPWIFCTI